VFYAQWRFIYPSDKWKVQPNLGENVAVNVAEQLSVRQIVIYSTIKSNVAVNTKYLSEQLNLNRKTIQRDLLVLRDKNLIQWIGSAKTGHWEVTK
jgi:predicted HTH transcriptional regulator